MSSSFVKCHILRTGVLVRQPAVNGPIGWHNKAIVPFTVILNVLPAFWFGLSAIAAHHRRAAGKIATKLLILCEILQTEAFLHF